MPSVWVGVHVNGREVQIPEPSVPALKSRAKVKDPPGPDTLKRKVRGPGLLCVAVTVQTMDEPLTFGELSVEVVDKMCTEEKAGAPSPPSSPVRHHNPVFGAFMKVLSRIAAARCAGSRRRSPEELRSIVLVRCDCDCKRCVNHRLRIPDCHSELVPGRQRTHSALIYVRH